MKITGVAMSGEIISRLQDVLLLLGMDGYVLDANPAALECYGYSEGQITSMHLRDLEAPQSQAEVDVHLREAAEHGGVFSTIHRRSDGESFPVEMISIPVQVNGMPSLLAIVHDTTERHQAADELLQSHDQLQAIVDNTPLLVYVKDLDGRFTFLNRRFEELFSPAGMTLLGRAGEEFLPMELAEAHRKYDLAVLSSHSPVWFEEQNQGPEGLRYYLSTQFPLNDVQGLITAMCGISTDITELKDSERQLAESNSRLEKMVKDITELVGRVAEVRDPYTQGHEVRVAHLAVLLAEELGLSDDAAAGLEISAMVHDIGKLSVPAEILSKPGVLSDLEMAMIRRHAEAGYKILKDIDFPWPVANAVLQHHERIDGSGYPNGLKGDEICLTARILAVADVVEAMSSHRPYRPALGVDAAISEISDNPERYDADVVRACCKLYDSGRLNWD